MSEQMKARLESVLECVESKTLVAFDVPVNPLAALFGGGSEVRHIVGVFTSAEIDEDGDLVAKYEMADGIGQVRLTEREYTHATAEEQASHAEIVEKRTAEVARIRSLGLPRYEVTEGHNEFRAEIVEAYLAAGFPDGEGLFLDVDSDVFGEYVAYFTHPLEKMRAL